jgi:hypothetical protein
VQGFLLLTSTRLWCNFFSEKFLSTFLFKKLRNGKNLAFLASQNVIFRKTARKGQIWPYRPDQISSGQSTPKKARFVESGRKKGQMAAVIQG